MNLFTRIRDYFRGEQPSRLRNKPGGMAWIKLSECSDGSSALNGRIVQTKRVEGGFWDVEPQQEFVIKSFGLAESGRLVRPGELVVVKGIRDDCLVPLPDTGITSEEVTQLYQSSPVKKTEVA